MLGKGLGYLLPSVFGTEETASEVYETGQSPSQSGMQLNEQDEIPSLRESLVSESVTTNRISEIEQLREENERLLDENWRLETRLSIISQENEDSKETSALRDTELRLLKVKYQNDLERMTMVESENVSLNSKIKEVEKQVQELSDQMNRVKDEKSKVEGELKSTLSLTKSQESRIRHLEEENLLLQHKVNSLSICKDHETTISALNREVDALKTQVNESAMEIAEQMNTIYEKDAKIDRLETELSQCTQQLEIEREDFEGQLKRKTEKLKHQCDQNSVLQKTINQTLQNHKVIKDKYELLKMQYRECVTLYQTQEQLLVEAADVIEAKEQRINVLLQTIDELAETLEEAKRQIDQYVS